MNERWGAIAAVVTILTVIVGTTVTIENRYAKSAEVKEQLREYYQKNLKLRILELNLKPNPTPSDRALLQYLNQELQKDGK
jgi:Mn2+/Fe2+ NRAMP family transporter